MHHEDVYISAHPLALRSAPAKPQSPFQKYPLSTSPAAACEDVALQTPSTQDPTDWKT
jgi:hypothetical protein